jgi:hypothetical protein
MSNKADTKPVKVKPPKERGPANTTPNQDMIATILGRPRYYRDFYRTLIKVNIGLSWVIIALILLLIGIYGFYWGDVRIFAQTSDGRTTAQAGKLAGDPGDVVPVGDLEADSLALAPIGPAFLVGWSEVENRRPAPGMALQPVEIRYQGWAGLALARVFRFNPSDPRDSDPARRAATNARLFTPQGLKLLNENPVFKSLNAARLAN